jgi:HK97 gp10 family phage protein
MPSYRVDGLEELGGLFDNLANIPDSVLEEMLSAEADIVVDAQQRTAQSVLHGPYSSGNLAGSIRKSRVKKSKNGMGIYVVFKGGRTRANTTTRNAEIAFLNEFGKRGQPVRPFIKRANEECADRAVNSAANVYDKWLENQ